MKKILDFKTFIFIPTQEYIHLSWTNDLEFLYLIAKQHPFDRNTNIRIRKLIHWKPYAIKDRS